jgi:hypothetical protein
MFAYQQQFLPTPLQFQLNARSELFSCKIYPHIIFACNISHVLVFSSRYSCTWKSTSRITLTINAEKSICGEKQITELQKKKERKSIRESNSIKPNSDCMWTKLKIIQTEKFLQFIFHRHFSIAHFDALQSTLQASHVHELTISIKILRLWMCWLSTGA